MGEERSGVEGFMRKRYMFLLFYGVRICKEGFSDKGLDLCS